MAGGKKKGGWKEFIPALLVCLVFAGIFMKLFFKSIPNGGVGDIVHHPSISRRVVRTVISLKESLLGTILIATNATISTMLLREIAESSILADRLTLKTQQSPAPQLVCQVLDLSPRVPPKMRTHFAVEKDVGDFVHPLRVLASSTRVVGTVLSITGAVLVTVLVAINATMLLRDVAEGSLRTDRLRLRLKT